MKPWTLIMTSALLTGCATTPNTSAPAPARIEALCRWGAYLAALDAGYHNHEPLLNAAQVIRDLSKANPLTPSMAIAALQGAGATWISCPEGFLTVTGTILLEDAIFGKISIEDERSLRAVLRGVSDGILLGLALVTGDGTPQEQRLETEAIRTRSCE